MLERTNQPHKPIQSMRKKGYCDAIQVWMIVVLAYCSGTVLSFDQPARSSLVPILVPKEDLMNAIALQTIVFKGSAVIGSALGGITIGLLSYAGHAIEVTGSLLGYAGNFFIFAHWTSSDQNIKTLR